METKIRSLFLILLLISCNTEEKKTIEYLSEDSLSMWDMPIKEMQVVDNDTIYYGRTISFLFHNDFICEVFNLGLKKERYAIQIGPKVNYTGKCMRWKIINDSTIQLNCKDVYILKPQSRDTLFLFDVSGIKVQEMYRVAKPWNINQNSLKIRNELIENEEYLDNKIY